MRFGGGALRGRAGGRSLRYVLEGTVLDELLGLKRVGNHGISVVLPALNEASTIGPICTTIRSALMNDHGLVDELLVIDSGSTDATAEIARSAGAVVHRGDDITTLGRVQGKGDCLWRSLAVATGDLIVWLDADTRNLGPHFVTELVAPLLRDERIVLAKAFYDRPIFTDDEVLRTGGARVTELVARPLLQLFYPELTRLIQPLSGEYAGRTDVLRQLPFFTGYGVEIALLIDIAERFGADRITQVDLGTRIHRNRPVLELGGTAFQVMSALLRRLDEVGRIKIPDELPTSFVQYVPSPEGPKPKTISLEVVERPPMNSL